MASTQDIYSVIQKKVNKERFREQHWEGSFDDYLQMVVPWRSARSVP